MWAFSRIKAVASANPWATPRQPSGLTTVILGEGCGEGLGALSDAASITATLRRRKIAVNQKSAKTGVFLLNSVCFA